MSIPQDYRDYVVETYHLLGMEFVLIPDWIRLTEMGAQLGAPLTPLNMIERGDDPKGFREALNWPPI